MQNKKYCLNPCSNGIDLIKYAVNNGSTTANCLNPCYNGIDLITINRGVFLNQVMNVLILVIME